MQSIKFMLQCAWGAPHPELFSDYNSRPCVLFIDGRLYHANTSVTFDRQRGCLFFRLCIPVPFLFLSCWFTVIFDENIIPALTLSHFCGSAGALWMQKILKGYKFLLSQSGIKRCPLQWLSVQEIPMKCPLRRSTVGENLTQGCNGFP